MTGTASPYETASEEVLKLTGIVLALSMPPGMADAVAKQDRSFWSLAAKLAQVDPPSQPTIDAVVEHLRRIEQGVE